MSPTSKKKVPRSASARTPDAPGQPDDQPPGQPPGQPAQRASVPAQSLPEVGGITDLTGDASVYAPQVKTIRLRTFHLKHNPDIPPPSRPDLPTLLGPLAEALFARHDVDQEHFIVLACNVRGRPYGFKLITSGTRTNLSVDPALVFRAAFQLGAISIILMHNHPSGDPRPSTDDLHLTARLITAGDIINIRILDHIILGQKSRCLSLRGSHPYLWP